MVERRDRDPAEGAIDWLIRQRDPTFDDWIGFTAWLEADPAHAHAYDRLAALDAGVADDLQRDPPVLALPQPSAPAGHQPAYRPGRIRRILTPLIGVSAAAAALVAFVTTRPAATYEIATAPGEHRRIRLDDGSLIVLHGGARLRLDRDEPRSAQLISGEALFNIVHVSDAPFRVAFAGGTVEDLGTRFTVAIAPQRIEVAVAEGAVAYRGVSKDSVTLHPGQRLVARNADAQVSRVAVGTIGAWATPLLRYRNERLTDVAADLSRALQVPVEADPALADMRVTATIQLDLDVDRSMARLAPLLAVRVVHREGKWILEAAP
ncbi:transmembrane sensor [Sphingomonas zeicaulis]|uniref:FecR family protein n=1 Tax=Sphingomonas zeicaulis TaxID=1632740 RepID=UPI003D2429D4